ncbi:MAG TPA: amidase family protein, partial [Conexibacter sp.]|nr:amidase family protein [Conexibacter sp.]
MEISRKELLRNGAAAAMAGTLPGLVGPIQDAGARATGPGHPQRPPAGEGLCLLSAIELRDLMRARRVSPVEVMEAHLARIERLNPALNAFVALLPDTALAGARAAERRIMRGGARPLEGLPVAIKDLFDFLAGAPNTFGSVPMKQLGFTPDHSSIYVQRLIDAGAIPIGKTNTP